MKKEIDQALKDIIKLINDNNLIQPKKKVIKKKQPKIFYGYNTNK